MTHPYARLFSKASAPTVNDDITLGYETGDVWHHTGGSVYDCRDATDGAAVWEERAGGSFNGDVTGTFSLSGDLTPPTIGTEQNDYNPTGLSSTSVLRLETTDINLGLTGLAGGADGRVIFIYNVGAETIFFTNEDTDSIAANRFSFGQHMYLTPGNGLPLIYDGTTSRWRSIIPAQVIGGNSHDHSGGDGGTIAHTSLSSIGTNTHTQIDNHISNTSNPHLVTAAQAEAIPNDGWRLVGGTWSYSSADDPTFVLSVDADATEEISIGLKVRLSQTTTKYFIITNVGSFSGGATLITIYGGTDYDLANAAIDGGSIYVSPVRTPIGFPLNPDKWTVTVISSTSNLSQASPTSGTWYNVGSLSGSIPIGCWRVFTEHAVEVSDDTAAAVNFGVRSTLSTTTNSETESGMTGVFTGSVPALTGALVRATIHREKIYNLAVKTTHYLLANTGVIGATSINFRGDSIATIVKAVCSYL